MKQVLLIFLLSFSLFGCTSEAGDTTTTQKTESSPIASLNKSIKTILFFMNPNGRPCQIQDQILGDMASSLKGKAQLKYVKTTNNDDRQHFYTYGVRSLPSLIILNKDGKEHKRFAPGIQSKETILAGLQ